MPGKERPATPRTASRSGPGHDSRERDALFRNLGQLAETLVRTLGCNCEVAVHDFRDTEHSLVHISGNLTGRSPGAPITNLVVMKAWKAEGDAVRNIANYLTTTATGRILKSSTCFIRDAKGSVIGAVGINLDLTAFRAVQSGIESLVRLEDSTGDQQEERAENRGREDFIAYLVETNDAVLEAAVRKAGKHPSTMNRKEKFDFVRLLEAEGAFLVKGMVATVARTMNISIYTVYKYLRRIKDGQD